MSKYIYTHEDSQQLTERLNRLAPVSPPPSGLPTHLQEIAHLSQGAVPKLTYFTLRKGKITLNIDDSPLQPSAAVVVAGKRFEERYRQQLDAILYTEDEELNLASVMRLMTVYEFIERKQFPVNIASQKYPRLALKMVTVLNAFFHENRSTLKGVYGMVNGTGELPKKVPA